jgi:hypothetical protein
MALSGVGEQFAVARDEGCVPGAGCRDDQPVGRIPGQMPGKPRARDGDVGRQLRERDSRSFEAETWRTGEHAG